MSVVAPLIHGLDMFGLDLMNKKAFAHTLVAKIGCLLPGTVLYAVSLTPSTQESITCSDARITIDEVSRKSMAWKIRHV